MFPFSKEKSPSRWGYVGRKLGPNFITSPPPLLSGRNMATQDQHNKSTSLIRDEPAKQLQSEVHRLKATIRVAIDGDCPMSVLDSDSSINCVEHHDKECTVEYITSDLDEHCRVVDDNEGLCTSVECDDPNESEVVRVSSHHGPKQCIGSTFKEHGFAPQIERYVEDHLVITTTFSDRDLFRKLISDLRKLTPSVHVDALQEAAPERTDSLSANIDVSVLTETQREFLTLALSEGYFDSPRNISQAELAEELGISPSMVSRRIRSIEQRLFSQMESSLDVC